MNDTSIVTDVHVDKVIDVGCWCWTSFETEPIDVCVQLATAATAPPAATLTPANDGTSPLDRYRRAAKANVAELLERHTTLLTSGALPLEPGPRQEEFNETTGLTICREFAWLFGGRPDAHGGWMATECFLLARALTNPADAPRLAARMRAATRSHYNPYATDALAEVVEHPLDHEDQAATALNTCLETIQRSQRTTHPS